MTLNKEKKYLLKNLPKEITGWVERTSNCGNRTVTKGKKYHVRNYFRYLNHYNSKGKKHPIWDEFIIIKNDKGWTVKMNITGFTSCDAPLTKIQILENRIIELKKMCIGKN